MGINQFTDLTDEQFQKNNLFDSQENCSAATKSNYLTNLLNKFDIPISQDWRKYNMVSDVKNQKSCGSCWTFSTTGALESHYRIYKNKHIYLSEQQLIDCPQNYNTHGCNGGLPSRAYEYIKAAKGIMSESDYPYKAKKQNCQFDQKLIQAEVPYGSFNITQNNETELEQVIGVVGPVSVAFQVISDFRHYHSGVYQSFDCRSRAKDINHAVLAVGYGFDDVSGLEYYIVKNSWGVEWGNQGYFKIRKGLNMCGIGQCNSFPNLGQIDYERLVGIRKRFVSLEVQIIIMDKQLIKKRRRKLNILLGDEQSDVINENDMDLFRSKQVRQKEMKKNPKLKFNLKKYMKTKNIQNGQKEQSKCYMSFQNSKSKKIQVNNFRIKKNRLKKYLMKIDLFQQNLKTKTNQFESFLSLKNQTKTNIFM